ncbi:lasso RiPP family leader peptide-containing protein [Natronolimnobius sp. AArcel1]|uniref:lasso RiPP family leader peptide-containing protein n=1 Tax=Natronolimnobius sp. AArcel1 TaxID=1679093 RepID=UPI0013EC1B5A|nr:lasso RiPP family leader peptide-containing protein [Natronolimnobius sp. AArcel1]NGM70331.1 lasso RiPP family leader peptide-containing protein [Natronolimnobius sp. AArcel1]
MSDDTSRYEPPTLMEYGTVETLTQNDKIGDSEDAVTEAAADTGASITGSIF